MVDVDVGVVDCAGVAAVYGVHVLCGVFIVYTVSEIEGHTLAHTRTLDNMIPVIPGA